MTSAAALLAVLAALLVAIPLMSTKSAAENVFEFVTGINDDGSLKKESKPYTAITTYDEFQKINENLSGNYVLEGNITLPSDWTCIGLNSPFTGCFDGNGYTITVGADTTGTNKNLVPFFNNSGVIHNLKVTGTVSVNTYFGSVVSSNGSGGYVIDCSSDAKITVTGIGNVGGIVGGIVGDNNGTVYKCQFTGKLATETKYGVSWYGGIAGSNSGTVDSCANYGSITGCADVGGIAGQNNRNGTVKGCLNAGDISANAEDAGGITGRNFGTISSSFTSGNVTLAAYSNNTSYGGICAYNDGTITGTYYDRGQFPGDGIGDGDKDGDKVDYTGVYPWEILDVEINGWNPAQVTNDSGETSKKRTTEYSLPYPNGASPADKTSSLFRFETKDGSAWKSYTLITNAAELKAISNNLDGSYVLENDITLSGDWLPLGMNDVSHFTGCFDGNGHNIKGLNVNEPSGSYQGYGLFGDVTGSVVDVNVEGSVLAMKMNVGGIVGYADGAFIKDCGFNGSVSGGYRVGGIVGNASGGTEISACYSSGSVTAKSSISGGIVGILTGNLTDCFSSAEVSGTYNVGGIIGSVNNDPTVTNCIFAGKVKCTEGPHGGISGQEGGSYTNCYYLSGSFDSGNYDTKAGTALSPVELASLTADALGDAWESGSVTALTEADSKYHIYKKDCTFPKLSKMAEVVTGSAEYYNFGIDGKDDYLAFTAIKTVDDLKNIEKDVTGNYVIMVDELDASGMKTLCDSDNKFDGKLAGNGCKLTLSKPLFYFNSGLVMGINAAGTIDGSSENRYGAIARENSGGTIYGCSFSGSLTALDYAGGVCGINADGGAVRNCYNTGAVTVQDEYAGGIVGLTSSSTTVSECYNTGSVSGNRSVGGIVGESESASKISDCLNTGRITGENDVGGIVGVAYETTVTGVLNAGIAYAPGYYGCISGASTSDSTYNNCYFIAELSAANYSGKGTGFSIGNIAELNLGSAWNTGSLGTLSAADSDGFKSQPVTLPSLKKTGSAQTAVAYQFNFKEDPSGNDNWLYTTRVTNVDELQTACATGNIALANDIVFTDSDPAFIALGVHDVDSADNLYGYFSGNGHTIKNIKLKGNIYKNAALLAYSYGVIMDLTMDGTITVTDAENAAAVCTYNYGTIIRCHNAADISGCSDIGGIAYYNYGTIINCWNTGSVTGESSAGGICYRVYSNGKVTGCYNTGALSAQSTYGIAEMSGNKIQNSYYLSADPGNDNNAKTAKAFASGEVAYLLNGDQSTIAWGQEIGKDSYPVPGGMRVYVSSPCMSIFTNDNSDLHREHKFGDWVTTKEPTYTSTGVKTRTCSICGATEEDTIPKKSGRPSGGSSGTSDSKPSINGKQKSWSDISSDIAKLPAGGSATINTNGETNVPADVIKSIKDSKAKVELIIDSTRSWIIDGLRISKVSAADLSILTGNADRSTLRGTYGADLKITGTRVPADLKLKFRKEFAGQFANLYKLTDGKLVFQNCVKVDENGAAIIPGADTNGEYIVMVCEFSDRLGDMNNDGVLNALDASAILKSIIGAANGANPQMADFNDDGKVNAFDASAILKWIIAA